MKSPKIQGGKCESVWVVQIVRLIQSFRFYKQNLKTDFIYPNNQLEYLNLLISIPSTELLIFIFRG